MTGTEPAIHVEALRKEFGQFVAVQDVSLVVAPGQTFALLGPNGAGKSTLIRMLTTLVPPTSGLARIAGCDVRTDPEGVRRAIGVIPQASTSDPDLTAAENLHFYARLYGVSAGRRRGLVTELLESVDLLDWRDELVGTFSGGMRRRLEIARGLVHQPTILFLDEPTTGLDPASRIAIWEMIRTLQARIGLTVFLTTHYLEEADHLCERVAIMDHGEIVASDTPANLKALLPQAETIEVEFGQVPAGWGARVAALPGVVNLTVTGDMYRIHSHDRLGVVQALSELARAAGVVVVSLAFGGTTLNDVFLQYTGRDLRDAAEGKRRLHLGYLNDRRPAG